jgi:hypothetical protein
VWRERLPLPPAFNFRLFVQTNSRALTLPDTQNNIRHDPYKNKSRWYAPKSWSFPAAPQTSSDAQALITENAWDFLHQLVSLERQGMYP